MVGEVARAPIRFSISFIGEVTLQTPGQHPRVGAFMTDRRQFCPGRPAIASAFPAELTDARPQNLTRAVTRPRPLDFFGLAWTVFQVFEHLSTRCKLHPRRPACDPVTTTFNWTSLDLLGLFFKCSSTCPPGASFILDVRPAIPSQPRSFLPPAIDLAHLHAK